MLRQFDAAGLVLVWCTEHQVHNVEGAGAEIGEEEAEAPSSDMEQEEEWEQQAGWGRSARGRKQVLDEGKEVAPEEARVEQADESGRAQTQKDKAAAESYTTNPPHGLPCGLPWSNSPHGNPRGKS